MSGVLAQLTVANTPSLACLFSFRLLPVCLASRVVTVRPFILSGYIPPLTQIPTMATQPLKKATQASWNPSLPSLPTELLKELPYHDLSPTDLYNLIQCNRRFSEIYTPTLQERAVADRDNITALIYAIDTDDIKLVRYLLSKGHDEMPEDPPWPALTAAFYQGNLEVISTLVQHLVEVFPDDWVDFADQASSGLSCLVHHTGVYDVKIVETLLDLGADPNGDNPLEYKVPGMRMLEPIPRRVLLFDVKDEGMMNALVGRGADIQIRRDGENLLENAIADPEYHGVVPVLLEAVGQLDDHVREWFGGAGLLHLAAEGPYPAIAELLVEFGFADDVDCPVEDCVTPIYVAAESEKQGKAIKFIEVLLRHGADIDALSDSVFPTPLLRAGGSHNWRIVMYLLHRGAYAGECTDSGKTVFHLAIEAERPDRLVIETMMSKDSLARVGNRVRDGNGRTVFEMLYRRAHRDFMRRFKIGRKLKRVFYDVMKWLSKREDRGGEVGYCYRWLWRHCRRAKRQRRS